MIVFSLMQSFIQFGINRFTISDSTFKILEFLNVGIQKSIQTITFFLKSFTLIFQTFDLNYRCGTVMAKFLFSSLVLWFLLSIDLISMVICWTSLRRASFIRFFRVFYLISSSIWKQAFCRFTLRRSISSLRSRMVFLSMSLLILDNRGFTFVLSQLYLYPVEEVHTFPQVQKWEHSIFDNPLQFVSIRTPSSSKSW